MFGMMRGLVSLGLLVASLAMACTNDVGGSGADPGADSDCDRGGCDVRPSGRADPQADDSDDSGGTDAGGTDAGGTDAGGTDAGGTDAGGTDAGGTDAGGTDAGGTDAPAPPGPPPAEAGQVCVEWTECGPWFVNDNSGFDCVAGTCVCNSAGNWDDECARIGGVWSDEECFCFVGASSMPAEDPDTWTADDEAANDDPRADRQCWWKWKETCEPDRWVDTSDYEWVCDSGGDCSWEYDESGYWESGDCDGYWIRRCDDGTEKRYGP
jgi:hypothetical protein